MVRELPLNKGYVALVDDEDFERASAFKWNPVEQKRRDGRLVVYAICVQRVKGTKKRTGTYLHRLLMNAPKHLQVDHENGNGLDCRRSNMRLATRTQNLGNQRRTGSASGYKGVFLGDGKWEARIGFSGRKFYLGRYDSAEFAALVYDAAARHLFGPFALTNFEIPNRDAVAIVAARFTTEKEQAA